MNQIADRRRIVALDGLRGIAVLMVVLFHCNLSVGVANGRLSRVVRSGWMGVDLFFVLSGFLITGILLEEKGKPHYFRNFYARRVLRIFPLYYGVIAACVIAALVSGKWSGLLHEQGWLWLYGVNLKVAATGQWLFRFGRLELDHFWSLAVEEHFYLIWPALVLLLNRRAMLWLCAGIMLGSPLLRLWLCRHGHDTAAFAFTPCRIDSLAAGSAVALLSRSETGSVWLNKLAKPLALVSLVGLGIIFHGNNGLNHEDAWTNVLGCSLMALLFASAVWLIAQTAPSSVAGRMLCNPVLVSIGTVSYGLYVLHMLVITTMPHRGGFALFAVEVLAASYALAMASYYFYERPFNRLKRYFAYGS